MKAPPEMWYIPVETLKGKVGLGVLFGTQHIAYCEMGTLANLYLLSSKGVAEVEAIIQPRAKACLADPSGTIENSLEGERISARNDRLIQQMRNQGKSGAAYLLENPVALSLFIEASLRVVAGIGVGEQAINSLKGLDKHRLFVLESAVSLAALAPWHILELGIMLGPKGMGEILDRALDIITMDTRDFPLEKSTAATFLSLISMPEIRPLVAGALNKKRLGRMLTLEDRDLRIGALALANDSKGFKI